MAEGVLGLLATLLTPFAHIIVILAAVFFALSRVPLIGPHISLAVFPARYRWRLLQGGRILLALCGLQVALAVASTLCGFSIGFTADDWLTIDLREPEGELVAWTVRRSELHNPYQLMSCVLKRRVSDLAEIWRVHPGPFSRLVRVGDKAAPPRTWVDWLRSLLGTGGGSHDSRRVAAQLAEASQLELRFREGSVVLDEEDFQRDCCAGSEWSPFGIVLLAALALSALLLIWKLSRVAGGLLRWCTKRSLHDVWYQTSESVWEEATLEVARRQSKAWLNLHGKALEPFSLAGAEITIIPEAFQGEKAILICTGDGTGVHRLRVRDPAASDPTSPRPLSLREQHQRLVKALTTGTGTPEECREVMEGRLLGADHGLTELTELEREREGKSAKEREFCILWFAGGVLTVSVRNLRNDMVNVALADAACCTAFPEEDIVRIPIDTRLLNNAVSGPGKTRLEARAEEEEDLGFVWREGLVLRGVRDGTVAAKQRAHLENKIGRRLTHVCGVPVQTVQAAKALWASRVASALHVDLAFEPLVASPSSPGGRVRRATQGSPRAESRRATLYVPLFTSGRAAPARVLLEGGEAENVLRILPEMHKQRAQPGGEAGAAAAAPAEARRLPLAVGLLYSAPRGDQWLLHWAELELGKAQLNLLSVPSVVGPLATRQAAADAAKAQFNAASWSLDTLACAAARWMGRTEPPACGGSCMSLSLLPEQGAPLQGAQPVGPPAAVLNEDERLRLEAEALERRARDLKAQLSPEADAAQREAERAWAARHRAWKAAGLPGVRAAHWDEGLYGSEAAIDAWHMLFGKVLYYHVAEPDALAGQEVDDGFISLSSD